MDNANAGMDPRGRNRMGPAAADCPSARLRTACRGCETSAADSAAGACAGPSEARAGEAIDRGPSSRADPGPGSNRALHHVSGAGGRTESDERFAHGSYRYLRAHAEDQLHSGSSRERQRGAEHLWR